MIRRNEKQNDDRRAQPNNSFNRSANSIAFIENLSVAALFPRPVNSSVMSALRLDASLIAAAPLLSHANVDEIIEWLVEYQFKLNHPLMRAHGI